MIVGFGRVGTIVGERLRREEKPFLVIEERQNTADAARRELFEETGIRIETAGPELTIFPENLLSILARVTD